MKEVAANKGANVKIEVTNVQVRAAGDTAVAAYLQEDRSKHNGKVAVERYMMYLDTYVRRQGAWQLVAASETPIEPTPVDPKAVRVDPGILDTYGGKYQWSPNNILTIWREGDKLVGQATGQEKSELLAENETTFFDKGPSWRWLFVKDASGKVTHLIFRCRGHDFEMPRMK